MLIEGFYGNTLQDVEFDLCHLPVKSSFVIPRSVISFGQIPTQSISLHNGHLSRPNWRPLHFLRSDQSQVSWRQAALVSGDYLLHRLMV